MVGALALALLVPFGAQAQGQDVPAKLQAAIFKKVFLYDRTLRAKPTISVVVLDEGSGAEVARAFSAMGVGARLVKPADLSRQLGEATVLYTNRTPGEFKELCVKNGVLTISGNPALVPAGDVSIALKVVAAKPKILINRSRAKAEGHELSSELLALSTLFE